MGEGPVLYASGFHRYRSLWYAQDQHKATQSSLLHIAQMLTQFD